MNGHVRLLSCMALGLCLVAGGTMLSGFPALAFGAEPAVAAAAPMAQGESETLARQLQAEDSALRQQALVRVRQLLEVDANRAVWELCSRWMPAMIAGGLNDQAADLALTVILSRPQGTQVLEQLQTHRVRALLAAGRNQEALGNAKSLYNLASMGGADEAMLLVAECLRLAQPDQPDLVQRFRDEQIAGAATRPTASPADAPAAMAGSVLAGIQIDPKPYEQAIAALTKEDYSTSVGQGNLLLLADRPDEAMEAFKRAYGLAVERDLPAATENIARAMKAQDGSIGRANSWILSLRPSSNGRWRTMMSRLRHNRMRAFSLVELIVVLAIIVLLIAMVLPAIQRSRRRRRSSSAHPTCGNWASA